MNQEFLKMLYMYSCGIWNKIPDTDTKITPEMCRFSLEQEVFPFFFCAVENAKNQNEYCISKEDYAKLKQLSLQTVNKNIRKFVYFNTVLEKFKEKQIKHCVLKGVTLSALYPNPVFRVSSDIDVFIEKEDVQRVSDLLSEMGFQVQKLFPTSHHLVAFHPAAGTVECHFELYDLHVAKPLFGEYASLKEDFTEIFYEGKNIPALGTNDGLNFTFFHFVKHFLSEGAGIKQIADVLMYIKHHRESINWASFEKILSELNYRKLYDALLTIGVEHLGFEEENFPVFTKDIILANELLLDIQDGGNMGQSDEGRKDFSHVVVAKKKSEDEGINKEVNSIKRKRMLYIIFPDKKLLEERYVYLKKSAVLYPLAWLHRAFDAVVLKKGKADIKNIISPESVAAQTESNSKRLELMKKFDII